MGFLAGDSVNSSVPISDFLHAVGSRVRLVSHQINRDQEYSRVRVLTARPTESDLLLGTLWFCPPLKKSEAMMLDSWLLFLARSGSSGLIVMQDSVSYSTKVLVEQLRFPVMTSEITKMGEVMDVAYGLLMGMDNQKMLQEMRYIDQIQAAWRESKDLEDFKRSLDKKGILISLSPREDQTAYQISWGRGRGTMFSLKSSHLSSRIVDHVALAIGVFLDFSAAEIESTLRHRAEFLLELLVDSRVPTGSMIRAAERYNLDLGKIHTVLIWDLDQFQKFTERTVTEEIILRIKGDVLKNIEAEAGRIFGHGIVLAHSDEFVLIVDSRERIRPLEALSGAQIIRDRLNALFKHYGIAGITCGIGFPYDGPEGLRKSFEEAHEALTVGRSRYGFGTIAHFKDLGLERFLYGWLDSPRSRELSQSLLQPLFADPSHKELFETLEVYLNSRGRVATVSQNLHLHRNTVRYRLDRIQQLLQLNVDDAATQLVLHLALKARHEMH